MDRGGAPDAFGLDRPRPTRIYALGRHLRSVSVCVFSGCLLGATFRRSASPPDRTCLIAVTTALLIVCPYLM